MCWPSYGTAPRIWCLRCWLMHGRDELADITVVFLATLHRLPYRESAGAQRTLSNGDDGEHTDLYATQED